MARTRRLPALVALVTLTLVPAGCTFGSSIENELLEEIEINRAIWEARRPSAYRMVLQRNCFCGLEARGPVEVYVAGDTVGARRYWVELDDELASQQVPEELHHLFPDVDGLFDLLLDAVATGADRVDVTWDPALGVPRSFFIDYRENVADEEQGYEIREGPGELQGQLPVR